MLIAESSVKSKIQINEYILFASTVLRPGKKFCIHFCILYTKHCNRYTDAI
jgi:hypothetical protein